MPRRPRPAEPAPLDLFLRIRRGGRNVLGPGRADLLEAIERTGSISAAARYIGMSYRRAWLLLEATAAEFAEPLVDTSHGGHKGGGTTLTATGKRVLDAYRSMQRRVERSLADDLAALRALLRGD